VKTFEFFKRVWLSAFIVFLTACNSGENKAALQRSADTITKRFIKKEMKLPVIAAIKPSHYNASQLRDPFKPFHLIELARTSRRYKNPLEKYALSELRYVGAITHKGTTWAVIHVPNGHFYRLVISDYLGQKGGRLTAIYANYLEVTAVSMGEGDKPIHNIIKLQRLKKK